MATMSHWMVRSALVEQDESHGCVVGLRHAAYPVVQQWNDIADMGQLRLLAKEYLRRVAPVLGLAQRMWDAPTESAIGFRAMFQPADGDPRKSLMIERRDYPGAAILDQSLVILFVLSLDLPGTLIPLGSRLGIRLHAWVREGQGTWTLGITSSMVSHELQAGARIFSLDPGSVTPSLLSSDAVWRLTREFKTRSAELQGLQASQIAINGIKITEGGGEFEVYQSVSANVCEAGNLPLAQTWRSGSGGDSLESHPQVAHVAVPARLFTHSAAGPFLVDARVSPADQSDPRLIEDACPNRSPVELEAFRHWIDVSTAANGQALVDPDGYFQVSQSRLVDRNADETQPVQVDPATLPTARTNDFAAVSAFRQTADMFATIRDFGLNRDDFFRFAKKPLQVRYRATIRPGPGKDGKTVNAQVEFESPACDFGQPWDPQLTWPLQMRFAMADLKRSASSREPLGIAADPRWSWHEFCHMMLAGATGKLELAFVHSIGDALAAIASDPRSALADDRALPGLRGATYPWVFINRRHDRPVRDGWSWSGTYHRANRFDKANSNCRHKGYDSEQILSTTLFRLYRCLGGDTVLADKSADLVARQSASDYVVYLVMRAILMLGGHSSVPIEIAEQLAAVLMDADAATMPAINGPLAGRSGGCATKVIRWAFEAQGMYAGVAGDAIHDAPGNPPVVDLFLDDFRPDSDGPQPRGGYMPISLDWNTDRPAWHATGNDVTGTGAIVVQARPAPLPARILVNIGNRGSQTAHNIRITVWFLPLVAPTMVPALNGPVANALAGWQAASSVGAVPAAIAREQVATLEFSAPLAAADTYAILVQVDCDEDVSILNPATQLPCSIQFASWAQLVAGDNNLGLRVYPRP